MTLSVAAPSVPERLAWPTEAATLPDGNLIAAAMAIVALRLARA